MAKQLFTLGDYLITRFEQIGLKHYFTVPGDFNLILLDQLLHNQNVEQICCCNELGASYAAEGYARAHGVGAIVTTYNVGAFSALNGVAGAYAEDLPIIFVSSSYNTEDPGDNHYIHHTLGTHDFSYQYEIIKKVTCEAVQITHVVNAPYLIDRAISAALRERKPAYIEIPCNLSSQPCARPTPIESLWSKQTSDPLALSTAAEAVAHVINNVQQPVLLAGAQLRSFDAVDAFRHLAEKLGCAVAVMPDAKGFFSEEHPQFAGIYWGSVSSPGTEEIVRNADLVIAAGARYTDYTTEGWTALPTPEKVVTIHPCYLDCQSTQFTNVTLVDMLTAITKQVNKNDSSLQLYHRGIKQTKAAVIQPSEPKAHLTHTEMARQIQGDLDSYSTLLVETGDAWFDGMYMHLPANARFEVELRWGSIGWSVPATLGYALGIEKDRRLIAMIGDGSFRETAQEISTMIRNKLENIVIFLINNSGYVVESAIHDGPYNYYNNWDYAGLMDVFNAGEGHGLGLCARTAGELRDVIVQARQHRGGPVLIECQIEHDDYHPNMKTWGLNVAKANARPSRQP